MESLVPLPEHAVHVWYVQSTHELDQDLTARYLALLAPEERQRQARFAQEKDRRQYLLGKVLVRTVLSRYVAREPHEFAFTANRHGKPVLADPPLRFNLSHTEGLVACAVAHHFEVGIDVENLARPVNLDIARRFFAPAEVAVLEDLPNEERQHTFFLFWTLKEAYVKARGMGLSLPLEKFAFGLQAGQAPTIAFHPDMRDDPDGWRFFLPATASAAHQMALAVQCGTGANVDVVVRRWDDEFTFSARGS